MSSRRFKPQLSGRHHLEFFPAPKQPDLRPFAAIVIPWVDFDHVLLCEIANRGWVVPSGRLEPNETSREAALREAQEEAKAMLKALTYIGCYRISHHNTKRWADMYSAKVQGLGVFEPSKESIARRVVKLDELPKTYYLWNELLAEIFAYSREVTFR